MEMKYFSMFSGIGGFEYGIEKAIQSLRTSNQVECVGYNRNKSSINKRNGNGRWSHTICVGFSEVDKYAIQIYKKHFPKHKEYGDATRIIPEEIPDFDLLVGGFPCQSFSIAGKRGGFKDTRGSLFYEIARIISVKRPKLLLLENVKGLLSHDKGRTFGTILATLSNLGYVLEWQVLNSKNYGVPQNRGRVFIIGHLGGICGQAVFPIGEDGKTFNGIKTRTKSETQLASTISTREGGRKENNFVIPKIAHTIDANYHKGQSATGMIRRLTPTECERLQGFPDGWTEGISYTQRYKCLGNAVTTNVITAIMERMLAQGVLNL